MLKIKIKRTTQVHHPFFFSSSLHLLSSCFPSVNRFPFFAFKPEKSRGKSRVRFAKPDPGIKEIFFPPIYRYMLPGEKREKKRMEGKPFASNLCLLGQLFIFFHLFKRSLRASRKESKSDHLRRTSKAKNCPLNEQKR